jgi:hypothetical protein
VPFCYVWTDDLNVEKCLLDKIFHTLVTSQEILARILEYVMLKLNRDLHAKCYRDERES